MPRRPKNYSPEFIAPPAGSPAERIVLMEPPAGAIEYLDRSQVCKELAVSHTTLRDKIIHGLFPPGVPFSQRGHIRKWPSYWVNAYHAEKIAAARLKVLDRSKRAQRRA